jgi:hypothetical protein
LMSMATQRWATGDQFSLPFPADAAALRDGGAQFLTDAFRASGALVLDNAVAGITGFREIVEGSTGRKVVLSVEYDVAESGLHTELFVKFSRDFDNPIRDRGKQRSIVLQRLRHIVVQALVILAFDSVAAKRDSLGDQYSRAALEVVIAEQCRGHRDWESRRSRQ